MNDQKKTLFILLICSNIPLGYPFILGDSSEETLIMNDNIVYFNVPLLMTFALILHQPYFT